MWHYPTAGQKKSEGAVFQKEQEVSERGGRFREEQEASEARSSERCFGGDASGDASGVLQGCFKGNASKGMLWDALGCSGMFRKIKGNKENTIK